MVGPTTKLTYIRVNLKNIVREGGTLLEGGGLLEACGATLGQYGPGT